MSRPILSQLIGPYNPSFGDFLCCSVTDGEAHKLGKVRSGDRMYSCYKQALKHSLWSCAVNPSQSRMQKRDRERERAEGSPVSKYRIKIMQVHSFSLSACGGQKSTETTEIAGKQTNEEEKLHGLCIAKRRERYFQVSIHGQPVKQGVLICKRASHSASEKQNGNASVHSS